MKFGQGSAVARICFTAVSASDLLLMVSADRRQFCFFLNATGMLRAQVAVV